MKKDFLASFGPITGVKSFKNALVRYIRTCVRKNEALLASLGFFDVLYEVHITHQCI